MSREQLKLEMVMRMNSTVVEILNNQDANESVTKKVHSFMKMINTVVEFLNVQIIRRSYQCKQCDETLSTVNNLKKRKRR